MISRQFRGLVHPNRAQDYIKHLREDTLPAIRKIRGFVDASVVFRLSGAGIEFLVVTRWQSLDAIARFAGPDPEAAVVPAKAAEMMIECDGRATHYEVVE